MLWIRPAWSNAIVEVPALYLNLTCPPSIPRLSLACHPLLILIKNRLFPSLIPSVAFDSILRFAQNTHLLRSSQSLITTPTLTTTTTTTSTTTHQTPQQTCVSKLPFSPLRPPSLSPAPRTSPLSLNALYVPPLPCLPLSCPDPSLAAPLESRRASGRYNPTMTHVTDHPSPRFLASSLLCPPPSALPPTLSASAPPAVSPCRTPSWPAFPPSAPKRKLLVSVFPFPTTFSYQIILSKKPSQRLTICHRDRPCRRWPLRLRWYHSQRHSHCCSRRHRHSWQPAVWRSCHSYSLWLQAHCLWHFLRLPCPVYRRCFWQLRCHWCRCPWSRCCCLRLVNTFFFRPSRLVCACVCRPFVCFYLAKGIFHGSTVFGRKLMDIPFTSLRFHVASGDRRGVLFTLKTRKQIHFR